MICKFENTDVSIEKKQVLNQLNWSLPKGKVIGLLGKNGAGKTTLIRSLLGLIPTNSGSLTVLGVNPLEFSDCEKSKLAYVPQTAVGYEGLKVKKAIDLHACCYPTWDHTLAERIVDKFAIDLEARVHKLSVGQRQAFMLLLALATKPELLIMDEPVASLDPEARRHVLQFVAEVSGGNCTILYSTHITADVVRLADYIAMLADGKIQFMQSSDDIAETVLLSGIDEAYWSSRPELKDKVLVTKDKQSIVSGIDQQALTGIPAESIQKLSLEELFIRWHQLEQHEA